MAHHLPLGKWEGKCKNNFCRSSKVNRIIGLFHMFVGVCICVSLMQLCSPLAFDFYITVFVCVRRVGVCVCVCVCVCVSMSGWEKLGGTEHKGTSEEAHRQHPPPPPSPLPFSLSLIHSPSSLLQRCACTLAVAPAAAAEARLLFKAALSFGLISFFFADVNRVASQSFMPLSLSLSLTHTYTHLIYKTTKKGTNGGIEEDAQNKMGTDVAVLFLPPPLPPFLVSGKTHFQSFPPVLPTMPRFRLVVEVDFCFNVHQLNAVI